LNLNQQYFAAAMQWRGEQESLSSRSTLRLCAGLSDACAGWIIDQYDDFVVAHHYHPGDAEANMSMLEELLPDKAIFLKQRLENGSGFEYFANERLQDDGEFTCYENERKFMVKPTTEHDIGLFLDTYSAREWVQEHAKGHNILNLFAYTCAFGVAGVQGGGRVTNIDPNSDYLQWGNDNAKLNDLDFRNLKDTTQKYLTRHVRRVKEKTDSPYDLIITDPPAFLVGRGKDRLGRKIWPTMLQQMEESGCRQFLLICNDRSFLAHRPWHPFLREHLDRIYELKDIPQSLDVLGQQKSNGADPNYHPPQVTVARL
jgi:23S rRNA G2069 N7-methylase RlmK/C1962 C5-methylase RlmI